MKIAINCRIIEGPWGGGNRFLRSLVGALNSEGEKIVYDLSDDDIDIILIMDPRWRNPAITFTAGDIFRYLNFRNENAIVVHRINECDERKMTHTMNYRLRAANYCADHTIFVGTWLKELNVWLKDKPSSVILNGADKNIFTAQKKKKIRKDSDPLSLVTHHWGGNWMKGFDIYKRIDELLDQNLWREKIKFTYIGNYPKNFKSKNIIHIPPLCDSQLADELRRHDVYITASINEPGGNHQNEGALSGLPILYRTSGCMPEYCEGLGEPFNENNFEEKLIRIKKFFPDYLNKVKNYSYNSDLMCQRYLCLFKELLISRQEIVNRRKYNKNYWLAIKCQLPM